MERKILKVLGGRKYFWEEVLVKGLEEDTGVKR